MKKIIREPLTHDITIYTGLTMILAVFVIAAHFFGGYVSVVEWRISNMLANYYHLNPETELGVSVALVLVVFALLVRGRHKLMPHTPVGAAR